MKHRAQCVQMWRVGLTVKPARLGLSPGLSGPSATVPKHRQHSEFSDFRGTLAGRVWKSSCWNPWKSGFREENQRCPDKVHPSVESSITSVLVSNCDRWNLKLVDRQPPNRVFGAELRSGALWCWTAPLRLMLPCQEKEERKRCLPFQIVLKAPRCCSSWNVYSYLLG